MQVLQHIDGQCLMAKIRQDELLPTIMEALYGMPDFLVGSSVVWTNGVFDILHIGHLELFEFARKQGRLIVGVNSDQSAQKLGKRHPVLNREMERASLVAACKLVDLVVIFDEPNPIACMRAIKPGRFVKGGDFTIEQLPDDEKAALDEWGGKVLVSPGVPGRSTTLLYDKIFQLGYKEGMSDLYGSDHK